VEEMIIVMQVNAPLYIAQGIKETIAMAVEKYGDTKVLEIRAEETAIQEGIKL
jgi:hypothetical protein